MTMKLEAEMYVRTKNRGIAKFRGWNAYDENKVAIHTHNEGDIEITPIIDKNTIIKASHNIIDLIEVGDYVNGHRVDKVVIDHKCSYVLLEEVGCYVDSQEDIADYEIKSIVTKEMFSNVEYRVETN